jgi:hypothetical protein
MDDENRYLLDSYVRCEYIFTERFIPKTGKGIHVLLTVPHDGAISATHYERIYKSRTENDGSLKRDVAVWAMVVDIMFHAAVCVVHGMMPRNLIDYNIAKNDPRPGKTAFVDQNLKPYYLGYHDHIACVLGQMMVKSSGKFLLIDMHGFTDQPNYPGDLAGKWDIILGTNYNTTVSYDTDRMLAEFLRTKGYRVYLPNKKPVIPGEEDLYPGKFTVQHYRKQYSRLDCIQVEVAERFRTSEGLEDGIQLAKDFAEAVIFLNQYLSKL